VSAAVLVAALGCGSAVVLVAESVVALVVDLVVE